MTAPNRGLFLTFEGNDGSGKTTQIRRLLARLRKEGFQVLETAEPGGTPIGMQIRRILLDPANQDLDPTAELLLYFASRAQNVAQWITPALAAGQVVVCDRFTDSTLVYQGAGRGLGKDVVDALHRVACGALQPDVTIYLDIDLETSLERARARNRDHGGPAESRPAESRMDDQPVEFHRAVRQGYLELAAREPQRVRVIEAKGDPGTIEQSIWQLVAPLLEPLRV
ncbi:MAG: dTMP kinase [Acidobacteriia bacterium]|nr:dTMP kinase [Terriglobia bacterium]